MWEFDFVIEHTAGKENLLADALARKHKYSLVPPEEQDFIPQSIDPTEDSSEFQDTSITTNNVSIVSIPEEITLVSCGCINYKHTKCYYNKRASHDERLGHYPSWTYLDEENDGDYEDYGDIKEEESQSDEDTLSNIPEEILDGYKFDPHFHVVEQDQLNAYHHISAPTDVTSSITKDDNISAIITNIINDAWEHYKQHRSQHNMDCHDYSYRLHGSSHQIGNRCFPTTRYSVWGTYGDGCLDCTLVEAVYQKEKEFQSSQGD